MTETVIVAGDACSLEFQVEGYQFPDEAADFDNANWLLARLHLEGGRSGRFTADLNAFVRTDDLARFRDQLQRTLETLDGRALLSDMDNQVGVDVRLKHGSGTLSMFVHGHGSQLSLWEMRTDQSYLATTLQGLDRALTTYPIRLAAGELSEAPVGKLRKVSDVEPLTEEELDRLEGLSTNASPAPWVAAATSSRGDSPYIRIDGLDTQPEMRVLRGDEPASLTDIALITTVRNYLPRLIAELRRSREG